MNLLIFLVENRNGRVKSHACADSSKRRQREGYVKEDSSSPTISTKAVFITLAIEAHKGREVACFGIPGAFLHAKCKDPGNTFMLLKGKPTIFMVMVKPLLYRKYVWYNKVGKAQLYVQMTKALYGC